MTAPATFYAVIWFAAGLLFAAGYVLGRMAVLAHPTDDDTDDHDDTLGIGA